MIYFDYLTANYAEIRSNLNAYPQSMILIEKVCTNYLHSHNLFNSKSTDPKITFGNIGCYKIYLFFIESFNVLEYDFSTKIVFENIKSGNSNYAKISF